jgi:hypothetical protein
MHLNLTKKSPPPYPLLGQAVLAREMLDLRKIFRFESYTHAVPLAPLHQMEFVPCQDEESPELGILWLRPRGNYPVYLRQCELLCRPQQRVHAGVLEWVWDGGSLDHVAAIAILKPEARDCYGLGNHYRRFLWVKQHDGFHGCAPPERCFPNRDPFRSPYHPTEAVEASPGSYSSYDRMQLRRGVATLAVRRKLDWGRVPPWSIALCS